jgi:fructokinase
MIVCCGEALIDFLPRKTADGQSAYQPFCGGSVYNTAVALGRLGVPTGLFTGLSTDFFGDMLREGLAASKVSLRYAKQWDKPSTLAFVKLSDGQARYSFFDDNSATRMLTARDLPKFDAGVKALHFGSISLIPEPCGAALELLLKREAASRVISFDPNIRASMIGNPRAHLARLNRMIAMADVVKASDEDVMWMTGKDDAKAAARTWLKLGARLVVITPRGEGGRSLHRHLCHQPPRRKGEGRGHGRGRGHLHGGASFGTPRHEASPEDKTRRDQRGQPRHRHQLRRPRRRHHLLKTRRQPALGERAGLGNPVFPAFAGMTVALTERDGLSRRPDHPGSVRGARQWTGSPARRGTRCGQDNARAAEAARRTMARGQEDRDAGAAPPCGPQRRPPHGGDAGRGGGPNRRLHRPPRAPRLVQNPHRGRHRRHPHPQASAGPGAFRHRPRHLR